MVNSNRKCEENKFCSSHENFLNVCLNLLPHFWYHINELWAKINVSSTVKNTLNCRSKMAHWMCNIWSNKYTAPDHTTSLWLIFKFETPRQFYEIGSSKNDVHPVSIFSHIGLRPNSGARKISSIINDGVFPLERA